MTHEPAATDAAHNRHAGTAPAPESPGERGPGEGRTTDHALAPSDDPPALANRLRFSLSAAPRVVVQARGCVAPEGDPRNEREPAVTPAEEGAALRARTRDVHHA